MHTGIHLNISHDDYHAFDAISNGYLKKLSTVPAAAKVPVEETPAMIFGRAVHAYVLEGEAAFDAEFAAAPECDRRTTSGKALFAEFSALNGHKTIIKADDITKIQAINAAVHAHPLAAKMLAEGMSEVTAVWQDKETGLTCKCRPDRIPHGDRGVILDLKTCTDASEQGFQRAVTGFGYYRQAAWYIDGVNIAGGKAIDAMVFIAVEKDPPYRTEVYVLGDDFVDYGREECRSLLRLEKDCREKGIWPHFANPGATDIFKPAWLV